MARAQTAFLDTGDRFPDMTLETVGHGQVGIDEDFTRGYGVVLIYRGNW